MKEYKFGDYTVRCLGWVYVYFKENEVGRERVDGGELGQLEWAYDFIAKHKEAIAKLVDLTDSYDQA